MYDSDYSTYFAGQLDLAPKILKKHIVNLIVIDGKSTQTAMAYFYDIIWLFRYLIASRGIITDYKDDIMSVEAHNGTEYNKIIEVIATAVNADFIRSITKDDIKGFVLYLAEKQTKASTRNRRIAAVRSFFDFCCNEEQIIDINPTSKIAYAKKEKKLPKYLTLEEAELLLQNIKKGRNYERNYCIVTFFLNCGFRLEELVSIDITDIKDNTIRIIGKGSKERILYLNESCVKALDNYMNVRYSDKYFVKDKNALFISSTNGERLKKRSVQLVISDCLKRAGLDGKGYSTHKLRHTAATLMYQYGDVDVLTLKGVLGHENLNTTQIYTHINNKQVKEALEHNPLAKESYLKSETKNKGE